MQSKNALELLVKSGLGKKMKKLDDFTKFRQKMNKKILDQGNLEIKRFFALDNKTYQEGTLDIKSKELIGLVAHWY